MRIGSKEFLRRRPIGETGTSQREPSEAETSPSRDEELGSVIAVHETAAQMLDRMAAALERKNAAARQNLAGGLNQVR